MTGEMSKAEVTREAYPLHFAIAEEFHGEVRPFDQYQGPYVHFPQYGRVWLCDDGDCDWPYWYSERLDLRSECFFPTYEDATTEFAMAFPEGEGWPPSMSACREDQLRLCDIGEAD